MATSQKQFAQIGRRLKQNQTDITCAKKPKHEFDGWQGQLSQMKDGKHSDLMREGAFRGERQAE